MKISLVIMAAGLGSRYGGDKQVDGIGPCGEFLMEYAAHDAIRAGFDNLVFVIKPGMEPLLEQVCSAVRKQTARNGGPVEAQYVCQDYSSLPAWFTPPEGRIKPYGTVHALLCAEAAVPGPFCVLNADDYYGAEAYRTVYERLVELPEQGRALMVGYHLENTLSPSGTVSRGICQVEEGNLQSVRELLKIRREADGTLRDLETGTVLDPKSVVSMNFWGCSAAIFPVMRQYFEQFLRERGQEAKSECLLPVMVDCLMHSGELRVEVLRSAERWFGMTYQADRALVAGELRKLHEAGRYPASLR